MGGIHFGVVNVAATIQLHLIQQLHSTIRRNIRQLERWRGTIYKYIWHRRFAFQTANLRKRIVRLSLWLSNIFTILLSYITVEMYWWITFGTHIIVFSLSPSLCLYPCPSSILFLFLCFISYYLNGTFSNNLWRMWKLVTPCCLLFT